VTLRVTLREVRQASSANVCKPVALLHLLFSIIIIIIIIMFA